MLCVVEPERTRMGLLRSGRVSLKYLVLLFAHNQWNGSPALCAGSLASFPARLCLARGHKLQVQRYNDKTHELGQKYSASVIARRSYLVGVLGGTKVRGSGRGAGEAVVHVKVPPSTFLENLECVDTCRGFANSRQIGPILMRCENPRSPNNSILGLLCFRVQNFQNFESSAGNPREAFSWYPLSTIHSSIRF